MALDGHVQPPAAAAGGLPESFLGGGNGRQDLLGQPDQALAGRRRPQRPLIAEEQRHAEIVLQPADLVRQRRLGEMHPRRGGGEAAAVADGEQAAQMAEFQHRNSFLE